MITRGIPISGNRQLRLQWIGFFRSHRSWERPEMLTLILNLTWSLGMPTKNRARHIWSVPKVAHATEKSQGALLHVGNCWNHQLASNHRYKTPRLEFWWDISSRWTHKALSWVHTSSFLLTTFPALDVESGIVASEPGTSECASQSVSSSGLHRFI